MAKVTRMPPGLKPQILSAASNIYAGLLATGKVDSSNYSSVMNFAIKAAFDMVRQIDSLDPEGGGEVSYPW